MKCLKIIPILLAFGCEANSADATAALQINGLSDVHLNGADLRLCGNTGLTATSFTALNPDGEGVQELYAARRTRTCAGFITSLTSVAAAP